MLLFVVLFFVYPLKFVFSQRRQAMMGEPIAFGDMSESDNRFLMWVYSAGFDRR